MIMYGNKINLLFHMKLEIADQSNTKFLLTSNLCPKVAVALNTCIKSWEIFMKNQIPDISVDECVTWR